MFMLLFSFLAMASPSLTDLTNDDGWTKHKKVRVKNLGTILVFKKNIGDSACYRAQSDVENVSFERLVDVSKDISGATKWSSSGVTESTLLSQRENVIEYYQYLKVPIIRDRHWFLRGVVQEEENVFFFGWDRIPASEYTDAMKNKIKKHPKAIIPPVNLGEWRFQKQASSVLVRYSICTHPGGSIPKRVRRFGTMKTLPTNVKEMVMEARRRNE
ncbi:MAG: hypothetical protein VX278_13755 [Myxococcota bacterium]|nr:hypothetical protein [Myxococcota bacterium]